MKANCFVSYFLLTLCIGAIAQPKNLHVKGLSNQVEVIGDTYGVNHIYATNEHDLFFAQGYCAAKDRLFQFELWRRQATGTLAEVLGTREVKRDQGVRLFKFRGDLKKELNHYHPHGEQIVTAFVEGINAFVNEANKNPTLLPLEFRLLGIRPSLWTPEVVISRHQGLLGNITDEVIYGRAVAAMGIDKLKDLQKFEPGDPSLVIDSSINKELLFDNVIELYDAFRKPITFLPKDVVTSANKNKKKVKEAINGDDYAYNLLMNTEHETIGSNNWIVSGFRSESGLPMLANDPHRTIVAPSLRYMVHLNAPGWNVVGGGEPTIPGVSIGHNEYGAWGLTIFSLDGEDLYVYELNPQNTSQYKYQNKWEDMRVIKDTIRVKGSTPVYVEHKYTRHGPVTFFDSKNNVAYAIRCAWMEIGGAPYMASLRIDQATSLKEFKEGCTYSHMPGENMIWADKQGDIGWQAAGIAPIRKNWSGLVPVPGDGRYEWSGFLPIASLPSVSNPEKGFWATANENLIPTEYENKDAVGAAGWADSFRADRINEVLASRQKHTQKDMMNLQVDYLSRPARTLVPLLAKVTSQDAKVEAARMQLLNWNYILERNSTEAAIYVAWEKKLSENMLVLLVPEKGKGLIRSIPLSKTIQWLVSGRPELNAIGRDKFLVNSLAQAVEDLAKKLGNDQSKWQYGQAAYHHVLIKHPLSNVVDEVTRKKLEVGPLPRGGNGSTPGMTTNLDNQLAGASFRMVVDVADWDKTMFTNSPGQSGDVASPFYKNLFELWATDKHFPVYFSKPSVEKSAKERLVLMP